MKRKTRQALLRELKGIEEAAAINAKERQFSEEVTEFFETARCRRANMLARIRASKSEIERNERKGRELFSRWKRLSDRARKTKDGRKLLNAVVACQKRCDKGWARIDWLNNEIQRFNDKAATLVPHMFESRKALDRAYA